MTKRNLAVAVALAGLLISIEAWYEHPTYGRGLQAVLSAIRFGEML